MNAWKSLLPGVLLGIALGGIGAWQLTRDTGGGRSAGNSPAYGAGAVVNTGGPAAVSDPLQTLTAIFSQADGFGRARSLYVIAGNAGPDELAALIVTAHGMRHQPERSGALDVFFQRYAMLDPGAAINLLKQLQLGDAEARIAHVIFRAWAETDPVAAAKAAKMMTDPHSARITGEAVAGAIRRNDPELADEMLAGLPGAPSGIYSAPSGGSLALAEKVASAPEEVLAEALAIGDNNARRDALLAVGDAWARLDPAAALAHGQDLADPLQRIDFLKSVMDRWSRNDPDSALGAIVKMDPGPMRHPLREVALKRLAQVDPAHAFDWAQRYERGESYSGYSMQVLTVWAGKDPHAAAARIADLPSAVRAQALNQIGKQFGRSHPRDALAWASQQDSLTDRMGALAAVAETVAGSDPDLASSYILGLSESPERNMALSALVMGLARNSDTARATTLAGMLPAGEARQNANGAIAQNWSLRDPQAALRWAGSLKGREQETVISNIVATWSQVDLPGALDYVAGSDEQGRVQLLPSVISRYVRTDPMAAMRWLDRYEGEFGHQNAMTNALYSWSESDPGAAARYIEGIEQEAMRDSAVGVIMQTWSRRDPVSAADWLADLDEGPGRQRGVQNLIGHLMRLDRDHATDWVMALDSGPSRDEGLRQLANNFQTLNDPKDALEWINEISSSSMRFQSTQNLVRRVAFQDVAAARAVLRAALLTPDQRMQLEATLNNGR